MPQQGLEIASSRETSGPLSSQERVAGNEEPPPHRQSAPLSAELPDRLLAWKEQLLPKHLMAEAVNDTLGRWVELNGFCTDGAVPINNYVSEREIKRVVLDRKDSLFAVTGAAVAPPPPWPA